MRIAIMLLTLGILQVNASDAYSQKTRLSVDFSNTKLINVLDKIEIESEFYFLYNEKLLDLDREVNFSADNQLINVVLDNLFAGTDVKYSIIDRKIILAPDYVSIKVVESGTIQQQIVTGKIIDSQSSEPMPGVNIQVKGTTSGTISDVEGNYSLSVPDRDATLMFSFIGYVTQEIPLNGRTVIDVAIASEMTGLDEVVVVGYGTQKKVNLTGAVDVVRADQIGVRSVTNVSEALQGISPNLNITTTGSSSEPGGKMNLNIRGIGSLTGDYSPYVLVDGVPVDLNLINTDDIESITVLKDAAASAIYGARAPYGVILVTTKKGAMNEKVKIEYSNNISFSSPMGRPHMENALNYMTAHDQASVNAGLSPNFTAENYERTRQYMAGEITDETWLKPDGSDWMGNGIWSIAGNGNNDWLYIYYKDLVMRQKHDINLSGGGEKNSFYVSAGYWDQPGELRYGDEYYKRYNVTSNIISKPTNWLTFNFSSKYISDNSQNFNSGYGGGEAGRAVMYHNFYRTNVFRPRYLPNGEFSDISNIDILNGGKENYYGSNFILSLGTAIEPLKNWITKIQYNYKNTGNRGVNNQETVWGTFPNGSRYAHAYPISSYATNLSTNEYTLLNIVTSYNLTINDHYFSILGGYENELNKYNYLWGQKNNLITPYVPSISTATGTLYLDDSKSHWATEGFFSRFNYNYKEKFLFEFNARYDGSSRFEKETRWGFFPSLSVGYNISKEAFWSSVEPYITSLKIRGSWGSLGNQNVPNYLYLSTLGIGTNLGWIMGSERPDYTTTPAIVSANLTWETSSTLNGGIEASFLKGRLSSSFDIYSRITSQMFGPAEALPLTLGTTAPKSNNATLKTSGFEFIIEWRDIIGANLSYNIRATIADNITIIKEYNNPTKTLSTWYKGAVIGEIWGLKTAGIYQSNEEAANGPDQTLFWPTWGAGDIHYQDLDDNNKITRGSYTADNSGDYSVIGNNSPRFLFGLNGGLNWKGIDFSLFWQGVLKKDYAPGQYDMTFYGFNGHQWWGMNVFYKGNDTNLDYWRPSGETNILGSNTDAYYAKPYLSQQDYKNKQIQTRFMQNAAYLRLKNLSIGYTIPSNITERIAISKARVFISGENLLTITPLTKLIDPENINIMAGYNVGIGKLHALRKVYALGINVTF